LAIAADKISVITTIRPIYSILKNVSGDVVNLDYLSTSNASAHGYNIKPSDIAKFQSASLIVIIDRKFDVEIWNILQKLKLESKVVELSKTPNLKLYKNRDIQILSNHEDDGHGHSHEHGHDHSHHHSGQDDVDFHIWLDIDNAKKMAAYFVAKLVNHSGYSLNKFEANLLMFYEKCDQVNFGIENELKPYKNKGFIIFHDGYQYFEGKYGLKNLGAIYYNSGDSIGLKTIIKVEELIESAHATCVLTEPYFNKQFISKLKEIEHIKVIQIDGESAQDLKLDQNTYFAMMEGIAKNIALCLE